MFNFLNTKTYIEKSIWRHKVLVISQKSVQSSEGRAHGIERVIGLLLSPQTVFPVLEWNLVLEWKRSRRWPILGGGLAAYICDGFCEVGNAISDACPGR